jgi:lipopolysaccharide export system permease protein
VSSVNPRVGRSGNLLFALFAFVLYYNLLNLGQNWVGSRAATGIGTFMLVLHGGALRSALWLAKRALQLGSRTAHAARNAERTA